MTVTRELRRTVRATQRATRPTPHRLADIPETQRLIGEYCQHQRWRNFSERTVTVRRSALRMFATFNSDTLLGATPKAVEAWLQSRPLSAKSKNEYLTTLHGFYVWAIREGLTKMDPTVRIARPKERRYLPRPIGEHDLQTAFRQADARMMAMLALAAYQGLRCCEIATLLADDVLWHHDPPLIHVREGKGGRERMLPLSHRAELALKAYGVPARGPVFPKRNGAPYRPGSISTMIAKHLHDLGIGATAHNLRHRFGSLVYANSLDLRLTQEMMGHASPATTQVYVAFSPTRAAAVVRDL